MKHIWFGNGSSVFIFMSYAVPGYVLGALMMVFLAARWNGFHGRFYRTQLREYADRKCQCDGWNQ